MTPRRSWRIVLGMHEITELLHLQNGALAHRQLRRLEPDCGERRRVRRRLGLEPVAPNVLGLPVFDDELARALTVRVLDAGEPACLWGKTAATWFGASRYRLQPVHIARDRSQRRARWPEATELHHIRDLDSDNIILHRGVPTIRPEHAWLWLCGMYTHRFPHHPAYAQKKCDDALEHLWTMELIHGPTLHRIVEDGGGRGRSGIVHARAVLETHPPDYQPYGSGTERRFHQLTGIDKDQFTKQVPIRDHSPIGVVDFAAKPWPLIVEINGERWHTSIPDRRRDDERYARCLALGYSVVVWWEFDIWHDPRTVIETTRRLLRNPDPVPTLHRPTPAPWEL